MAEELVLVENEKSDYVIRIPAYSAGNDESFPARELSKHIRAMTGTEIPVWNTGPSQGPEIVLTAWCDAGGVAKPDPLSIWSEIDGDGFGIVVAGRTLFILGKNGRALLYGVYHLLHRWGCRWPSPELAFYAGDAEMVPKTGRLSVPADLHIVGRPALAFRKLYVEEGHSHTAENLLQIVEWMPKVGYNTLVVPMDYQGRGRVTWDAWREKLTPELKKRGILIEVGGHGYQNFINAGMAADPPSPGAGEPAPELRGTEMTLFERHPHWFGANAKGTREKSHGRVFCTSNPEAVAFVTANVVRYLKDRPEIGIFDFWPPDGAHWCECAACAALGGPSDRQAILANHVRGEVAKACPTVRLEVLAYHTSITPPGKETLDQSILLDFCPSRQSFEFALADSIHGPPETPYTNAWFAAGLRAWRKSFSGDISIYSYYRKYAWDSLPVVFPHYIQREMRFYASLPVQGISTYAEPDDWATYELNHYVLAKLAWNPETDVDAIVREFCDARYGSAAEVARRALGVLEDVVPTHGSVIYTTLKTVEKLTEAERKLKEAKSQTDKSQKDSSDDRIRPALGRLGLMLEYAIRDLGIQKARASGAPKDEVRKMATDLQAWAASHANEGVFLVKNHRLTLPGFLKHYEVGGD